MILAPLIAGTLLHYCAVRVLPTADAMGRGTCWYRLDARTVAVDRTRFANDLAGRAVPVYRLAHRKRLRFIAGRWVRRPCSGIRACQRKQRP